MPTVVKFDVNGIRQSLNVEAERSLLEVLRDELELTGSKYGCGEGQCGACTVLINGQATRSCITSVGSIEGKRVTTIEGLTRNGRLHPVQEAFIEAGAMQCGYCTAGMIMSAVSLLEKHPKPSEQEIVREMEGNVCRCCTYPRIISAVNRAASNMNSGAGKARKGGAR
jgi:aerobic-type carbon monoxide dehydrogenase small subunit (CoxS/CutS family)